MEALLQLCKRNRALSSLNVEIMREIGVNDKALAGALAALESASFDHFHAVLQNELESRGRSAAPLATAQRMHKLVTGLDSEKRQKVDMAADSIVASAPAEECPHSPAAVQEAAHAPLDLREGAVDTPSASIPTVSFRSMKRAGRTLEDFFKTYLLFIDAERTEELTWKLLPTLSWLEGTIYFVDEENERAPPAQEMLSADADRAWQSMVNVMKEQGLWTPPIEQELRCGLNYWSFERRMKGSGLRQPLPSPHRSSSDLSLASGKQAEPKTANHQGDEERKHVEDAKRGAYKSDSLQAHRCDAASCLLAPSALESRGREQELSESMIKAALEHKSFDYRLLNLVAHTLLGKHLAPEHARFLRCSEALVEIEDDLADYEDDVIADSFNVYRLYVRLFGPADAPRRLAKWMSEIELELQDCASSLPPPLVAAFHSRSRAAMEEAGAGGAQYVIPPAIADEAAFRSRLSQHSQVESPNQ